MESFDLSVIICTLNRSALLRKCLESLVRQDSGAFGFETIVVDNGSTDDTKAVADLFRGRLKGLRYVPEPRKGLARARQTGFEVSAGKYVAYLDDDAIAAHQWSLSIFDTFKQIEQSQTDRVAALGGPIEPIFETARPSWLTDEVAAVYAILERGNQLHPFPVSGSPVGANMAFLRTVLLENPWDHRLLMCEEVELFGRLARRGLTFLFVPGMRVRHFIPAARLKPSWVMERYLAEGLAVARLPLRFPRKARLTLAAIVKLVPFSLLSALGPATPRLEYECKVRFYYGFLKGVLGLGNLQSMGYLSTRKKVAFKGDVGRS